MEISWDHSSVLPFLNRFFRAVSWHWPLTAVPGRGAGSAWGAVTPLPPSREALKPFCRKARGERKQGEKEREEEREREINKQKLAASVLSSRAGSAAGAGARLWFCLTDVRAQGCPQHRGQGTKRCQTVSGAQGDLGRSEQAAIPSRDVGLHPTGSFQLLLCQHLRRQSLRPAPATAPFWGSPGRDGPAPPPLCRSV